MNLHQPNAPHPDFARKSLSMSQYAEAVVENDTRIGHIFDRIHQLGLDKNTLVLERGRGWPTLSSLSLNESP